MFFKLLLFFLDLVGTVFDDIERSLPGGSVLQVYEYKRQKAMIQGSYLPPERTFSAFWPDQTRACVSLEDRPHAFLEWQDLWRRSQRQLELPVIVVNKRKETPRIR